MALSQEQKQQIAQQLADKRKVLGDTGFETYIGKLETAIPQRQVERTQDIVTQTSGTQETSGLLGKVSRFTGVDALAKGIAASLNKGKEQELTSASMEQTQQVQSGLIQGIKDAQSRGDTRAVANLEKELQRNIDESQSFSQGALNRADLGVSNRDVIGSALRTAGTIASAGTFRGTGAVTGQLSKVTAPALTSATGIGRGVLQGAGRGAVGGAQSGAIFGGVSGTATGIEQNKGVLGTAFEAVKQGAVGGVLGGAVGGVVGGIGGGFQAKTNRKNELTEILQRGNTVDEALTKPATDTAENVAAALPKDSTVSTKITAPSKTTAGYRLEVVPDKPAQRLLKQGVDSKDVSIMQSFSPADKQAAREMVKIAQEVSDSGIATQRQQEVVGKAFMRRAKDVEKLNKVAGQQIDDVARTQLSGVKVNASAATDDFFNQLERSGVDIDQLRLADTADDIAKAFDGSDFEGIATAQKTIKNVLKRVDPALDGADMDGLALHRAKRFIDNQVTYGKNAEGLVGDAERLLKGLRSSIDDVLDTNFTDYNKANTQYRDTIGALDEMRRIIGKDFLGSQDIANLRAGEVMNRLLGNASARPLSALQNLENTSRKYGNTYSDSVIKQITFADLLDDIYETVPKRGFSGQTATGVERATGFMERMRQGGLISASIDTAGDVAKSVAGITPEARQKAVEEFLELSTK